MPKRWRIATHDAFRVAQLQEAVGVSPVVAQLLLRRGLDNPEAAKLFLNPKLTRLRDPETLPGLNAAADLIYQAVQAGDQITIFGDYDADGMTAAAILLLCLRKLGGTPQLYVPCRQEEGYGLNVDAVRQIAQQGTKLIISVDCGITAIEEARLARELGMSLVVTDHHQPTEERPPADAIVHPGLPEHDYPFDGLCGAAVAFKLAWALCQRASDAKKVSQSLKTLLMQTVGLAAIGTVADVVPLVDENRVLVRQGLNCLKHYPTIGFQALEKVAGLQDKRELRGDDIAFAIAPRLNAAGRMGQASLAVELLATPDPARAAQLAEYMQELNTQRQSVEQSVYLSALKQAKKWQENGSPPALVLSDPQWHAGVIGIVAGRLAEKFHCPVVLIANYGLSGTPGVGSARSIPGFNLHAAIASCTDHLIGFGGHEAAAGLRIDADRIDAFRIDFCAHASNLLGERGEAELPIDAETLLASLTNQTVSQIEEMAPFGNGNEQPILCTTDVRLAEPPRRIGNGKNHLSVQFEQHGTRIRAVAFGKGDWEEPLRDARGPLAIAFRPVINTFRGRRSVEMHLTDWRTMSPAGPSGEHRDL